MRRNTAQSDDEHIMLRNKPDSSGAVADCIGLGIMLVFYIPLIHFMFEDGWDWILYDFTEFFLFMVFIVGPGYGIFLLIHNIHWKLFGGEIVHYSSSAIYIQQKKLWRREVVIPWDSVTDVEPYDEPIWLALVPTKDPTVCLTYKTPAGTTRKIRFGFHLNKKQQAYVVERVRELCVESFEK